MSLPHTVTVELYYSGSWHDITSVTLIRSPLSWSRGWSPNTLEPVAAQLSGAVTDPTGTYNPLDPNSTLYGLVGRNTPIRVKVAGVTRWTGEASWKPRRSPDGQDRWVEFTAGGLVQRLGRGATPLRGALERAVLAEGPLAYWPLNDGASAERFASGLVDGQPLYVSGMHLAQVDGPPGASGKYPAVMESGSYVGSAFGQVSMAATGAWTVEAWVRASVAAGVTTASAFFLGWRTTGGEYSYWNASVELLPTSSGILVNGDTSDGSTEYVDGTMNSTLDIFDGNWHRIRLTAVQNGSNAEFTSYVDGVVGTTGVVVGANVGTITEIHLPYQWWTSGYTQAQVDAIQIAQITVYDSDPPDLYSAGIGYTGEYAIDRINRLCGEEGVTVTTVGTAAESAPMGPQPVATLLDLLNETARTDGGILFEEADAVSLKYVALPELYRQTPAVTLQHDVDLTPTLQPVLDDQDVRNDVTASSTSVGQGRVVLETGPMSVLAPPNGVGRYDTTLQVNPASESQLSDIAGWFLSCRTSTAPRYEGLTIDIDASPAVAVGSIEIGSVVTVTGVPDDPEDPILLVTGISETATNHRRTVSLDAVQAQPYDVGVLDTEGFLDCGACTTNEALDTTETGVDVLIADACTWTHASGDFGILVGGELMTVTAVSAVGGSLGAYTQTLTVTRSVNGIVKSHATGAEVHVAEPFILAR